MKRSTVFALLAIGLVLAVKSCGPQMLGPGSDGGGGSAGDGPSIDAPSVCNGTVVDPQKDPANCGGCGLQCPQNLSCVTGSCTNDPGFSIDGLAPGSPSQATVAGQVWVVLNLRGLAATPAPLVTFGDTRSGDGAVAAAALGDWHLGAARMYGRGANADLAHLTAIAPPHTVGRVPITVEQGGRTAILLGAFQYVTVTLPAMWTTRGKISPDQSDPDGSLLGFLVGRADRPGVSALPDGRVVVAGGNCAANSWCAAWSLVEVYEPVTGHSTAVAGGLQPARAWIEALTLVDGRVLLAGGVRSSQGCGAVPSYDPQMRRETCPYMGNVNDRSTNIVALAQADLFDPITGTVSPVGPMTAPRSGHTLTLLGDGRVLLVGGSDLNHWGNPPAAYPPVEIFDPASASFAAASPAGLPNLVDHAAGRMRTGEVLIAGGRTRATHPQANAATYKVAVAPDGSVAVTPLPALARPIMDHTPSNQIVLAPEGNLFLIPGFNPGDWSGPLNVWDRGLGMWVAYASSPAPTAWPGAALLGDGAILVCGGANQSCGGLTVCSRITTASFQTAPYSALATLVRESPMIVLPSGGAMMTGGTSGMTPTDCGGDAANNTLSLLLPVF